MEIYTTPPDKGHPVLAGEVIKDCFCKKVTRTRHYFNLVSGYAIQNDVYTQLQKLGVNRVVIFEKDTGDYLTSDLEAWIEHSGKGNWGSGRQRVLSEKYMTKERYAS